MPHACLVSKNALMPVSKFCTFGNSCKVALIFTVWTYIMLDIKQGIEIFLPRSVSFAQTQCSIKKAVSWCLIVFTEFLSWNDYCHKLEPCFEIIFSRLNSRSVCFQFHVARILNFVANFKTSVKFLATIVF